MGRSRYPKLVRPRVGRVCIAAEDGLHLLLGLPLQHHAKASIESQQRARTPANRGRSSVGDPEARAHLPPTQTLTDASSNEPLRRSSRRDMARGSPLPQYERSQGDQDQPNTAKPPTVYCRKSESGVMCPNDQFCPSLAPGARDHSRSPRANSVREKIVPAFAPRNPLKSQDSDERIQDKPKTIQPGRAGPSSSNGPAPKKTQTDCSGGGRVRG